MAQRLGDRLRAIFHWGRTASRRLIAGSYRPKAGPVASGAQPPAPERWVPALLLAGLGLTLAGLGTFVFLHQRQAIIRDAGEELALVAVRKVHAIEDWRERRITDLQQLTRNPSLVEAVEAWLHHGALPEQARQYLADAFNGLLNNAAYESLFLLDPKGGLWVVAGRAPAEGEPLKALAARSAAADAARVSDFLLRQPQAGGAVRIDVAVPVRSRVGGKVHVVAVLVLRDNPYRALFPMLGPWPVRGRSGDTLLVQRRGDKALFLSLPRGAAAGTGGRLPARAGLVETQAVNGRIGAVSGLDYRGRRVLADLRPVPGTPWRLVTKMDRAEVVAPVDRLAGAVTATVLLAMLIATALLTTWWRKERAQYLVGWYRGALQKELLTRHFDLSARYANDAILLLDAEGRILEANERAGELYGRDHGALLQRHWDDLGTAGAGDQEWRELRRHEPVVYEALHRRGDGSAFPVEVSARCFTVEGRAFYQAIVRDTSERKQAERRVSRLTHLYAALSQTNQAIIHHHLRDSLFQEICDIAVRYGRFSAAWIGLIDAESGLVAPVVRAGSLEHFMEKRIRVDVPGAEGRGPGGTAIRERRVVVSNDFLHDPATRPWRAQAARYGVHASAAMPLEEGGIPVGVFMVYAEEVDFFDRQLVDLLQEMALDIAFALDNFRREANRRRAERALQESEARFRALFERMSGAVAVYAVEEEGRRFVFKDVNRAFERIERLAREQVIGRTLTELFPQAEAFGLTAAFAQVWRSGIPQHLPARLYRDERISGWRENEIYRLPRGDVVAVYDDVTERREAEEALRRNEERLSLVLRGSDDGFWDYDIAAGCIYFSPRWAAMLGYRVEEIEPTPAGWEALVHPDDLAAVRRQVTEHLKGRLSHYEAQFRMRTRDGGWRWILARGRVVARDGAGHPLRMAGTHTDVTERREAEEQLRLWARVFEASGEAIFITDAERRIVSVNRAFTEVTGYRLEEVLGRDPSMLSSGLHDPGFYQNMWAAIAATDHWHGEIWDRRKDGETYPQWLAITAARDTAGTVTHYIAIFSDISERKEAEERIQFLAHHDFLTGLPNRGMLHDRLSQALDHAQRSGGRVAVLFVDLDRFKTINDSLGHDKGDLLLKEVADRLRTCVRLEDTVSRQGGDEFIVALGDIHTRGEAAQVAQKIVGVLSRPYMLDGVDVHTTPSLGIAVFPDDGADIDTLIRNADAAMYLAKERGRNNFQFYISELNTRALERLALDNALRRAVEQQELVLVFQPQVNLGTCQVIGAEALVRWCRPDAGNVSPGEFIPLAEESGLIAQIGEWVMRQACRQQREWVRLGLPRIPVAVNISALQFHQPGFPDLVARVIAETGIAPADLEVEVTEGILMKEVEGTVHTLRRLKEMGVTLAIDDFGTGYSSLSYLRRFPIDRLKVDQSFIRHMERDRTDLAITEAIIALGKSLGVNVIAEGVETREELVMLRERDCLDIQGFYFSEPLAGRAFVQWFRHRHTPAACEV